MIKFIRNHYDIISYAISFLAIGINFHYSASMALGFVITRNTLTLFDNSFVAGIYFTLSLIGLVSMLAYIRRIIFDKHN